MKLMIRLAPLAAAVLALAACQPPLSRVETLPSSAKLAEPRAQPVAATSAPTPAAPAPTHDRSAERAATLAPTGDRTAALEARLAKLEADYAKNAEALEFLNKVYQGSRARHHEAQGRHG